MDSKFYGSFERLLLIHTTGSVCTFDW